MIHPHVYTLGKSGKLSNLLLNKQQLEAKGASFYKINRGGDITYHGPGQRIIYLMLDLRNGKKDIKQLVWNIEEWLILVLKELGLAGYRIPGLIGVWVKAVSYTHLRAHET